MAIIRLSPPNNNYTLNVLGNTTIKILYGNNPSLNGKVTRSQDPGSRQVIFDANDYEIDPQSGNFTNTSPGKIHIEWGDGTITDEGFATGFNHTYNSSGTYTVSAWMRDPIGNQSQTETFTVIISDVIEYCGDETALNYKDNDAVDALRAANPNSIIQQNDEICQYPQTWIRCGDPIPQTGTIPADYIFVVDQNGEQCWDSRGGVTVTHGGGKSLSESIIFRYQRDKTSPTPVTINVHNSGTQTISRRITLTTSDLFSFTHGNNTTNPLSISLLPGTNQNIILNVAAGKQYEPGDGITDFSLEIEVEEI